MGYHPALDRKGLKVALEDNEKYILKLLVDEKENK